MRPDPFSFPLGISADHPTPTGIAFPAVPGKVYWARMLVRNATYFMQFAPDETGEREPDADGDGDIRVTKQHQEYVMSNFYTYSIHSIGAVIYAGPP
jgi:hypothetical protein